LMSALALYAVLFSSKTLSWSYSIGCPEQ